MNPSHSYREMNGITNLLKILLAVFFAAAVIGFISSWLQFQLLTRESFSHAEAQANDIRQHFVALFTVLVYLVTAVVFGRWIYRANRNVRALGAQGLRFTPGWAVGYFFVPIFNWWRPYQAMKDLWRASQNPAAWQGIKPGSILGIWWGLWLASNLIGYAAMQDGLKAHDLATLKMATFSLLVEEVVRFPLCVCAFLIVTQIDDFLNAAKMNIAVTEPLPAAATLSTG